MNRSRPAARLSLNVLAVLGLVLVPCGCASLSALRTDRSVTTTRAPNDGTAAPDAAGGEAVAQAAGSLSPAEVIRESLFGDASSDAWTPLYWQDLFTNGWNDPFVFGPASDSGALRQEWINAANGVFYRQWVVDYFYRNHVGTKGNQDDASWFIFAPLSRRLEILFTVPFLDYGRVDSPAKGRTGPYRAQFGDISVTPQVLIHETRNTSIMGIMTVETPTGGLNAGNGNTSLNPQLQFWQGLPRKWVVRGGFGPNVPLSASGMRTALDGNLTVGKFLTLDEVRYFKEFTVYLATNVATSVDDRGPNATSLTLFPGVRWKIAPEFWFLSGVEISTVGPGHEAYALDFRLVKRY